MHDSISTVGVLDRHGVKTATLLFFGGEPMLVKILIILSLINAISFLVLVSISISALAQEEFVRFKTKFRN